MVEFLKKRKVIILMITLFLSIYGFYSLITIRKEATPSINIPMYYVSVTYPGADSNTVEEQVTNKLEQKFKGISLIKKISSTSSYNIAVIQMEFYESKKDADAMNDIKSAIDQVSPNFPSEVKDPLVKKIDINDEAMYIFSVAGPYPTEVIYPRVKDLEDNIKAIAGVGDVTIIGKPEQEIKVMLDSDKIANLDMDIISIVSQLKAAFIKYPTDKKEIGGKLYSFELSTYPDNLEGITSSLKDLKLFDAGGKSIRVGDLADVLLSYKKEDKKSFIVQEDGTEINGVSFQIKKVPGFDIQKVTLAIKTQIDEFAKDNKDLKIVEVQSQEQQIEKIYDLFYENFYETGLLVLVIIFLFLGLKPSLIILIGFVIVYLINFMFLKMIGYSFNNIISFALILVLGVMVDNLIVIMEGIIKGARETKSIWGAVEHSLRNYAKAIIMGTSSTILIFLPMIFLLSGILGQFMKPFPVAVDSNLAISLIVAVIVLPVLFATFIKNPNIKEAKSLLFLEFIGEKLGNLFVKWNKKKRGSFLVMVIFWVVFAIAISFLAMGIVKVDFMGNSDSQNIRVNIKYPAGIFAEQSQEYTEKITKDVVGFLDKNYSGAIETISVDLGSQGMVSSFGDTANLADIAIKLVPDKQRVIKSYNLVEDLQNYIVSSVKPKYNFIEDIYAITAKGGPSNGKPVGFYIVGDDLETIGKYVEEEFLPEMRKIDGLYNISTSLEYTSGRFKYILDPNKLKEFGINNMSAATLMMGLKNSDYEPNGISIKDFNEFGKDTISIKGYVNFTGTVDNQKIGNIYMSQLLTGKQLKSELIGINRIDAKRAILIESDKYSDFPLSDATKKVDEIFAKKPLPSGASYRASSSIEMQNESTGDLGVAMILGIALMFILLVIQFNNIKYATIIITSIFLSIGGAIYILALFGYTLNFPAEIGLFGVLGVGVNQAVIHIEDFKIFYEEQGMSVLDAFKKSISIRFVPIFLTKAVTILGLVILAFKDEMFGSLALAFIGGLLMSFFITLVYIPAFTRLVSKDHYVHPKD